MTLFNRLKRLEDATASVVKPPLTAQERQELHAYLAGFIERAGPQPPISNDEMRTRLADFKRRLQVKAYPTGRPA